MFCHILIVQFIFYFLPFQRTLATAHSMSLPLPHSSSSRTPSRASCSISRSDRHGTLRCDSGTGCDVTPPPVQLNMYSLSRKWALSPVGWQHCVYQPILTRLCSIILCTRMVGYTQIFIIFSCYHPVAYTLRLFCYRLTELGLFRFLFASKLRFNILNRNISPLYIFNFTAPRCSFSL